MNGPGREVVPASAAVAAFQPHAPCLARRWRQVRENELGRQVGVTAAAVSQYEFGQARPSGPVLARIALVLGMPVAFFASAREALHLGEAPVRTSCGSWRPTVCS